MDAKIFVYCFCLVALFAGGGLWSYTMGIDEVQKELILARNENQVVLDTLSKTKSWLAIRKEAAALIGAAAIMKEKNEAVQAEIQAVQNQRSEVAKNFMSTIAQARAATVGMVLPEITLSTGASLKNAKVQSLDEETALIQHSQGVTKVATSSLSAELQDRLRFGFMPGGVSAAKVDSRMNSLATSVSDRLAKIGINGPAAEPKEGTNTATPQPAAATSTPTAAAPPASTNGEVPRSSLGRVYTPGKGWQRTGVNNFVVPKADPEKKESKKP